ncbi:MAG: hypothetical protein HIU82_09790 [Proteobacteria bacterium]|nr:hypothetical protein [Pseudomonadota bacterium]
MTPDPIPAASPADLIAALAHAAGLDTALADFPDDVAAAAAQALATTGAIRAPADPAVEPWPPMRPGIGL